MAGVSRVARETAPLTASTKSATCGRRWPPSTGSGSTSGCTPPRSHSTQASRRCRWRAPDIGPATQSVRFVTAADERSHRRPRPILQTASGRGTLIGRFSASATVPVEQPRGVSYEDPHSYGSYLIGNAGTVRSVRACQRSHYRAPSFGRGGGQPTIETPPHLIEPSSKFVHDEGLEQLANLPVDALLDSAVLAPAIAVSAALVSGLAARMVDVCEDHLPRRRFD